MPSRARVTPAHLRPIGTMTPHAPRPAAQTRSVLVVEDDSTIVANLVDYLESRG